MWQEKENELTKIFMFNNFSEAFAFIGRVALLAEKENHHPTIINTWNKVELRLSTHDAGHIVTEKDLRLAGFIDKLIQHHD